MKQQSLARSKEQDASDKMQESCILHPASCTLTPPRYEVKIPLPAHWLADVESWVQLHPAQWRVTYPPRQVNNIYFDTARYEALNANLSGVGEREKLRLRWYGPYIDRISGGNLERKRKQGMAGWKEIAPVKGEFDLAGTAWRAVTRDLRAAVVPEVRPWLDVFAIPTLINHYWRAYYATPDEAIRLTIDTALCAYDQRAIACPNLTRRAHMSASIVVELKADPDDSHYRRLSDALAGLPAPVGRFSKYIRGITA